MLSQSGSHASTIASRRNKPFKVKGQTLVFHPLADALDELLTRSWG